MNRERLWVAAVVAWGLGMVGILALTQPYPGNPVTALCAIVGAVCLGMAAGAWVNWGWSPFAAQSRQGPCSGG
jgi:hypothetical protein